MILRKHISLLTLALSFSVSMHGLPNLGIKSLLQAWYKNYLEEPTFVTKQKNEYKKNLSDIVRMQINTKPLDKNNTVENRSYQQHFVWHESIKELNESHLKNIDDIKKNIGFIDNRCKTIRWQVAKNVSCAIALITGACTAGICYVSSARNKNIDPKIAAPFALGTVISTGLYWFTLKKYNAADKATQDRYTTLRTEFDTTYHYHNHLALEKEENQKNFPLTNSYYYNSSLFNNDSNGIWDQDFTFSNKVKNSTESDKEPLLPTAPRVNSNNQTSSRLSLMTANYRQPHFKNNQSDSAVDSSTQSLTKSCSSSNLADIDNSLLGSGSSSAKFNPNLTIDTSLNSIDKYSAE